MPDGQYPRNWFDLDLSHNKPYISISPLVVYKNLLFPVMYSRLEQASTQIKFSLLVIVECDKIFQVSSKENLSELWGNSIP